MRVNVYSEELTTDVHVVEKGGFHGLRFVLKSAAELHHTPDDDDRSAVTFWGLRGLKDVLRAALAKLESYDGLPDVIDHTAEALPVVDDQAHDPFEGLNIKDMLNMDNWTEQTGFGSPEGAKCPHCQLIVRPHELPPHPGQMICPACMRPFKWTVIVVAGMTTYSTLTLRPEQPRGAEGGAS